MNSAMGNFVCARLWRAIFVLLIITQVSRPNLYSQMSSEGGALLDFIASEQQHGSVLTYSQSYMDDQNERVSYTGTLYTGIQLFKLDGCKVMARIAVEDRFSGAIEHKSGFGRVHTEPTGNLTDDTVYEYRFSLAELSADGIHDLLAMPAQLNVNTSVRCEEDRSCNLSWLRLMAPHSAIAETRTVNGIQDKDARVTSIVLPMVSPEIAGQAAKLFSGAVRACSAHDHE
jgi:hypothetical protein